MNSDEIKEKVTEAYNKILIGEDEFGITKLLFDEKIKSLLDIDEQMANLMIDFAQERAVDGISTRELAIQKWQETIWHKTIKAEVDKLRNLRKELE